MDLDEHTTLAAQVCHHTANLCSRARLNKRDMSKILRLALELHEHRCAMEDSEMDTENKRTARSHAIRDALQVAAELAHTLGWDLAKFQDQSAAFFLTTETHDNANDEASPQSLPQPAQHLGDDTRASRQGPVDGRSSDTPHSTKGVHGARFARVAPQGSVSAPSSEGQQAVSAPTCLSGTWCHTARENLWKELDKKDVEIEDLKLRLANAQGTQP